MHLTKAPQWFNMSAFINILGQTVKVTLILKILGLHIDAKLKWGPHLLKVKGKIETQILGLTAMTKSTWGATLNKARQVYSAVIHSTMIYGSNIWRLAPENPQGREA